MAAEGKEDEKDQKGDGEDQNKEEEKGEGGRGKEYEKEDEGGKEEEDKKDTAVRKVWGRALEE